MFKYAVLFALMCALVAQPAAAQDLDINDILARYYEAVGGLDAWKSVESMKVTGKMSMRRGMEVPFTRLVKRPNKIRMEFTMQGMTGIRASDGETAWMLMPFRGESEPQIIEGGRGGPGGQAVTMERIELNVEIDDSVFAMPGKGESQ
jgi:outer membrane lipoprotein-sorting protein